MFEHLTDQQKAVLQAVFVSFDQGDSSYDLEYVDTTIQWETGEKKNPCGVNQYDIYTKMRDELEEAETSSMPMSGTSKAGNEPPPGEGFDA